MASEPSAAQRKLFAKMHYAMPDGSFYIRPLPEGKDDLENAIKAVGRGEQGGTSGNLIRKHIMMRAAAIKLSSEIPKTWSADGTLKEAAQSAMTVGELLEHHGVKGMHWGVRKVDVGKAARTAKRDTYKVAGKVVDTAINHPIATVVTVRGAQVAYQHREEIKNTAYILAKIGTYAVKQATTKDSPLNETLAIGRQVVQGYVVHGIDGVDALKPEIGTDPSESDTESSDHDRLLAAAKGHESVAASHMSSAAQCAQDATDLQKNGLNSAVAKSALGKNSASEPDWAFQNRNGTTKSKAVAALSTKLSQTRDNHVRLATHHIKMAQKLKDKASSMAQDGLNFDPNFDIDVYLSHFGVKGMHWGVRKERGEPSADHVRVSELRSKVNTGRGVHVLSNDELQDVNTRLNLETNYARLVNGGGNAIDDGEKFVKGSLSKVKLGIDAIETGQKALKIYNSVKK